MKRSKTSTLQFWLLINIFVIIISAVKHQTDKFQHDQFYEQVKHEMNKMKVYPLMGKNEKENDDENKTISPQDEDISEKSAEEDDTQLTEEGKLIFESIHKMYSEC